MLDERFDCVIAGGGLAAGLVALAVAAKRPGLRLALVEAGERLGGNHTWSFHESDVAPADRPWLEPLVAHRWGGHRVCFPSETREMPGGYATITSARFESVLRERCRDAGHELACGERVLELSGDGLRTASGRVLRAPVVLDARGLGDGQAAAEPCGYQKFLGQELELEADAPARLTQVPTVMDATVAQADGFRFVYLLPFSPRHLLLEDTYYASTPGFEASRLRERLAAYAAARGLRIRRVLREESGVLPLPFRAAGAAPARSPFAIGYRGGWFHPLTGYSVPLAVRVASAIADAPDAPSVARALGGLRRAHVGQARFCGWLSRLMFRAVAPERRWELLARFYRMPAESIARFYALQMTMRDRLRLLAGSPPRALSMRAAFPEVS